MSVPLEDFGYPATAVLGRKRRRVECDLDEQYMVPLPKMRRILSLYAELGELLSSLDPCPSVTAADSSGVIDVHIVEPDKIQK